MKKITLSIVAVLCAIGTWASPFSQNPQQIPPSIQYAGWNYSMPINVTENTGSNVINYQLQMTINTQALISAGQMNANGDDIRFGKDCAGNTLYNYWIESGINTASTVIWVKIDTLFANATRTIYMFYGNNSASAVSAVNGTFVGPMSSTDSVNTGGAGGVGNSQRGFRFAPTEDLLVTDFGKNEPTGTTRYVTLFNYATQAIIVQTQVSGPAAQYSYSALPNPIWLTQATQYVIEVFQGASDGYYFGSSSQVGQHLVYGDMRYCNSCTQNTFPTNTLSNYQYGYPDFWYYIKNNISVAPTVTIPPVLSTSLGADLAVCPGDSVLLSPSVTGGTGSFVYSWSPLAGISSPLAASTYAVPSATTNYIFAVIDNANCGNYATDTIQVTVYPQPFVAATTLTDSICAGDTADLYVTGASSYVWQPGGNTTLMVSVAPSVSTTYTVVGTDNNGCHDTAWVPVTVNQLPVISVTGSYSSVCDNAIDTLTMTASGAQNYAWTPLSATTATVTDVPTASTVYTVMGTDTNGCSNTSTYSVTLLPSPDLTVTGMDSVCAGTCVTMNATPTGGTPAYTYSWVPANATGSSYTDCPTTSTCQTVTVTDSNGCMATVLACNYVYMPPMVVAAGPAAICAGDTAILNATGSNLASIDWSPSASLNTSTGYTVYATPSATTTYTIVGTSPEGCTDTTMHDLTVNPLPTVSFTSSVSTVCSTDPAFALTGGSPAGGAYSGPGVSGGNFSPSSAGTGSQVITYTYSDGNGCSADATHTIVVDPCTGITEQISSGGISIFPNPFAASMTITRKDAGAAVVNLYDTQGRLVLSQPISGTQSEIETSGLAAGAYSLQIVSEKGIESFKVIKKD